MAKTIRKEIIENLKKLPDECWSILNTTNELIKIKAGESGYYKIIKANANKLRELYECSDYDELADKLNEAHGITKGQREAMEMGSMWGWHVPGANPDSYNDDGTPKRESNENS